MELKAQKELLIMSPNGLKSGWRDTVLSTELTIWVRKDGIGIAFSPSAELEWLIDPYRTCVYIYRPGTAVECLENPATIRGDPILPGFVFNGAGIW
jgi:Uma2 family endonuclease